MNEEEIDTQEIFLPIIPSIEDLDLGNEYFGKIKNCAQDIDEDIKVVKDSDFIILEPKTKDNINPNSLNILLKEMEGILDEMLEGIKGREEK